MFFVHEKGYENLDLHSLKYINKLSAKDNEN